MEKLYGLVAWEKKFKNEETWNSSKKKKGGGDFLFFFLWLNIKKTFVVDIFSLTCIKKDTLRGW